MNSTRKKRKRKIENKDEHTYTISNWSLSNDVSPSFSLLMICHEMNMKTIGS